MMKRGQLDEAVQSPVDFIRVISKSTYRPQLRADDFAPSGLFADRH